MVSLHDKSMQFPGLTRKRLIDILPQLDKIRIGVLGDACLDIYWIADMTLSELSRETPHFPLPIVEERTSPGAGANVAACMAALGVGRVEMISIIGTDWRGRELTMRLKETGVDIERLLIVDERITPTYCKPIRRGISDVSCEDPRLDFDNRANLSDCILERWLAWIQQATGDLDAMVVVDQLPLGVVTAEVREWLGEARFPFPVVVDSRDRIGEFRGVVLKPNEIELLRAVRPGMRFSQIDPGLVRDAALQLQASAGGPVCVTRGEAGALWVEEGTVVEIPTARLEPPLDPVGAGDAFLAAFTAARSVGATGPEAAALGNLVAAIVTKKIGTTGTATPEEILQRFGEVTGR